MALRITDKEFDALEYDLDAEIARYQKAREDHKSTVDVPAPTAPRLVEEIVRRFNGEYEIATTKTYVRIVDNVIIDKKDMAVAPASPDWVEKTRPDQLMSHFWDEESQAWIKPGTKEARMEQLEKDNLEMKEQLAKLMASLTPAPAPSE